MPACAEFTVRPRHLTACSSSSRMRLLAGSCTPKGWGSMGLMYRYNDTGFSTLWMKGRWSCDQGIHDEYMSPYHDSHKCVGEIAGYWSASPYAGNATNAWNVNFNNGNDNANNKTNNNYVRLVRGGEWIT